MPYTPRLEYTFKAETSLVEVGVVVRNNIGRAVPGLTKENFRILESGKPREVTSFSVQTAANAAGSAAQPIAAATVGARRPRYVAVLYDDILLEGPPPFKSEQ
jgi:hypothetical protein